MATVGGVRETESGKAHMAGPGGEVGVQLSENLFEKAVRQTTNCLFNSSNVLGTAFSFMKWRKLHRN